jgi:hypothetical protein
MTFAAGRATRSIWLYSRGDDSVRIEVRELGHALQLVVCGPGSRQAAYDFADAASLIEHQASQEAHLLTQGYCLESFNADRRAGKERRRSTRVKSADRRRPEREDDRP